MTARVDESSFVPFVARRSTSAVLASASYSDLEVAVAGEEHRRRHVGVALLRRDQSGRSTVPFPYGTCLVVSIASGDPRMAPECGDLRRRSTVVVPPGSIGSSRRQAALRSRLSRLWGPDTRLHGGRGTPDTTIIRTPQQVLPDRRPAQIFAEHFDTIHHPRDVRLDYETFGVSSIVGPNSPARAPSAAAREQARRLGVLWSAPKAQGAVTVTSSPRLRPRISSRSASPSANQGSDRSRSPRRPSIPS